jgi:hypothetical protein
VFFLEIGVNGHEESKFFTTNKAECEFGRARMHNQAHVQPFAARIQATTWILAILFIYFNEKKKTTEPNLNLATHSYTIELNLNRSS